MIGLKLNLKTKSIFSMRIGLPRKVTRQLNWSRSVRTLRTRATTLESMQRDALP